MIDTVRAKALEVLTSGPGPAPELVVLFGSAARGEAHPGSDIDIGIIPADRRQPLKAELEAEARLTLALGREVDLVRLDTQDVILRWEVARDGILLWERAPGTWAAFRAEAALDYADFAPLLEEGAKRYAARLAAGMPRTGAS